MLVNPEMELASIHVERGKQTLITAPAA